MAPVPGSSEPGSVDTSWGWAWSQEPCQLHFPMRTWSQQMLSLAATFGLPSKSTSLPVRRLGTEGEQESLRLPGPTLALEKWPSAHPCAHEHRPESCKNNRELAQSLRAGRLLQSQEKPCDRWFWKCPDEGEPSPTPSGNCWLNRHKGCKDGKRRQANCLEWPRGGNSQTASSKETF